jgi:O-succinylbenzoate synthase
MRATLWQQDVHFRTPISAASQRHASRSRLFLELEHDGVTGYGEVAPQPRDLNGDAGVANVIDEVRCFVLPQLADILDREGVLPQWSRIARIAGSRPASNPAVALLEMALLDRELRGADQEIADLWTPLYHTPRQLAVSLLDATVDWEVGSAARVRAKTSPGRPSERALEQLERLQVPVLLDFNCSATTIDEVIEQVRFVQRVAEVAAVEQPFAVGNIIEQARLGEQLDVALCVDEGLRSLGDLAQLIRYRAASIVCVKPARVGGLANARTIIAKAHESGIKTYVGGFFESPFGRRVNQALAVSSLDEPSDLGVVDVILEGYEREVDEARGGFNLIPSREMLDHSILVTTVSDSTI